MREIYTSPRDENINRVVAMLAEHGIETKINNRASYQRSSYKRFSYTQPGDTQRWPQVEVRFADDLPKARALLREAGLEPLTRHADVLAASRASDSAERAVLKRKSTVRRARTIAFAAIVAVIALMVLRMTFSS
ncbi:MULTISPECIES: DUF2007 domain-containing protein [Oleiagrimonas]|jgi:hypothetical protein|uniref:DUF2007 domain-containing protein n=1 Tax=Oleiagrimonas citrea TaxID=1665687 RepID=A0A846ZK00_9GAMM|nr:MULTISPECIES: DUF2007 domain-containing protein [Oleiagrimonas]NKZ37878.1 DUF2007 domain-containing protein [Oleiagrimonas citrea]RAP57382.1 hypothetical protein BTJ49_09890 [Oleiagrimonas sp. MCCC 1A03011]